MLHAVSLGLVLFVTWLLLSGFFEVLLLTFGVVSCVLVVWIAQIEAILPQVSVRLRMIPGDLSPDSL